MGRSKSNSKRKVYSNTILPQEARKISNKQPNLTPKATREKKKKHSRRKEIINLRAEINQVEILKKIEKINETKSWFSEKINKINKLSARLIKKKKGRVSKSLKSEMKKEKLQPTPQKYKKS